MGAVFPLKGSLASRDHFADAINQLYAQVNTAQTWQAVTFQNSWVNYDAASYQSAGYWKDPLGVVHLRGMVKDGTIDGTASIFTLPAGYRPLKIEIFGTVSDSLFARVDVLTDGKVIPTPGSNTWFSLAGLTFRTS